MTVNAKIILAFMAMAVGCRAVAEAQISHTLQSDEQAVYEGAAYDIGEDEILSHDADAANFSLEETGIEIPDDKPTDASAASASGFGVLPTIETIKDHYRRSSICLILMVHTDKPYAEDMVRVFQNFPMPARYNEHNISLRVVKVKGKQRREDIERMLHRENVGREVVGRWFNRSADGLMNMDLVHERGGYGAFHDDYMRTVNTVRGTATLRDEGVELLESTFVLVCDMEYAEQNKGFKFGAALAMLGSAAMTAMSSYKEQEGAKAELQGDYTRASKNYSAAQGFAAGSTLVAAGAAALNDLSKFRVKIKSYLYRLNWDVSKTASVFNTYWVDETTPEDERESRRQSFDNAVFGLDYVGYYSKASAKTKLVSCTDVGQVVLDVCGRSVEETVKALAQKYVVFRPRTPFYCENGEIYSLIGTKEDVSFFKKYEIVKRTKNGKGKVEYKRVGIATADTPWQNTEISFDRYFNPDTKGTRFTLIKGRLDYVTRTPGLQLREMK